MSVLASDSSLVTCYSGTCRLLEFPFNQFQIAPLFLLQA